MEPYEYPVGFNVSCYNCFNGSIDVTVLGGVAPYTYLWQDGATTADRTSLGAGNYYFEITDANNCVAGSEVIYLTEPERNDWTMSGNAGTTPGSQYIGTSDNKDVVFKTNGAERVRLGSSGSIRVNSLAFSNGYRPVYVDSTGILRSLDGTLAQWNNDHLQFASGCPDGFAYPWTLCGNNIVADQFLGTLNEQPLVLVTFESERMRIASDGKIGIGVVPPLGSSSIYKLYVAGGIATRDVKVTINTFNDHVFRPEYSLMPLDELRAYLHRFRHLPGIPSEAEIRSNEGVELGDFQMRMLKVAEEQALYILQLQEQFDRLKAEVAELRKH